MLSDLRQATRSLLKSPAYTSIALITLALGIGVNSSMFSVIDALLLRSAPFPEAERLVQLASVAQNGESRSFSATELREIQEHATAFTSLTAIGRVNFAISRPGEPAEEIAGVTVSSGFFDTFGTQPMLGRAFTPEEFQPGRNQVVVLSYAFWQERYGGAPDILGRTLRLDGENVTIVGIMPPLFDYRMLWRQAALWRPLNYTRDQIEWRDYRAFTLIGRLAPGATPARVAAELAPLAATQLKLHPESYSGLSYRAIPLHEALMDNLGRRVSWMLMGLAGFVLLIACANLANLQLARATTGLRELAIRAALGASRARLVFQQLLESVVLSLGGGILGLAVAFALNRIIDRNFVIAGAADSLHIQLAPSILALTLGVSLVTGILFGIAPAWFASRTNVNAVLKQQSRGASTGTRSHHRVRQVLIVGEVALALVLLGGAAILQHGFATILDHAPGWDTNRILSALLTVSEARVDTDAKRAELYRRIEQRLAQLPGVEHAALATSIPVYFYSDERQILVEGQTPGDATILPKAYHNMVTPDYFATMGIPLLEGRGFAAEVKPSDPRMVIVNEALARRLWPGRSAVGQRLASMDSGKPYWAEIIGVVRDVDTAASTQEPETPFQVYKPLVQEPWSRVNIIVRSPVPGTLVDSVRRALNEVDPDLATSHIGTVPQMVNLLQHNLLLAAQTLTGFALLGLVLASVGLYGVISNLVAQRTGEFGIRLALGASPAGILQLVLRHGIVLCSIGLALGLVGACLLARILAALMPRIASLNLLLLAGVSAVLFLVAVFACWFPARRATKVDPLIALRAE